MKDKREGMIRQGIRTGGGEMLAIVYSSGKTNGACKGDGLIGLDRSWMRNEYMTRMRDAICTVAICKQPAAVQRTGPTLLTAIG